jgi:hypothetical protein
VLKLESFSFAWPGVGFDCSDLVGHVVPSMEANTEGDVGNLVSVGETYHISQNIF